MSALRVTTGFLTKATKSHEGHEDAYKKEFS